MFQLILLIVMAPLIWKAAQKKATLIVFIFFVVMLAVLQGLEWIKVPYIVFYSFVYYLCGVYIVRYRRDILISKYKIRTGICIVLASEIAKVVLTCFVGENFHWITSLPLAIGLWWIFNNIKVGKECTSEWRISFLMYAVHPAMATVMFKVWEWIIPNKDVLLFLCYLAQPFIITLIIMLVAKAIRKRKIYRWLTGERI